VYHRVHCLISCFSLRCLVSSVAGPFGWPSLFFSFLLVVAQLRCFSKAELTQAKRTARTQKATRCQRNAINIETRTHSGNAIEYTRARRSRRMGSCVERRSWVTSVGWTRGHSPPQHEAAAERDGEVREGQPQAYTQTKEDSEVSRSKRAR
jgi:hypothetical protein